MTEAPPLLTAVLDAGDRLLDALEAGTTDEIERVVDERAARLAALLAVPRPSSLPAELVARVSEQDERLTRALDARLHDASVGAASAGRTADALSRYTQTPPRPSTVDTAPRTFFRSPS